jgi:hypothetical protein
MRQILSSLLLFALPLFANGRIFAGTAQGSSPYFGKFAFSSKGGQLTVSNIGSDGISLLTVTDTVGAADCTSTASGVNVAELTSNAVTSYVAPSASKPFFLFMYFCSIPGSACGTAISTTYRVDARQSDNSQLSYEEIGLPWVYAVFWLIASAQGAFHTYKHYMQGPRFDPGIVRALTVTLLLHFSSNLFHLIEWATVANSGVGNVGLVMCASLLRLAAQVTLWAAAAFVALGFGITSTDSSSSSSWRSADVKLWARVNYRGIIIFVALVLTYVIVAVVYAAGAVSNPTTGRTQGSNVFAALILIALTLAYIGWFIRKSAFTRAAEVNLTKRALLTRLTYVLVACFAVSPVAEFFGA